MQTKLYASGLLLMLVLGLSPVLAQTNPDGTQVFSDVDNNTNYHQAIEYLKNNKIVQGYPDGTYGPERSINRAEFTKILIGAVNSSPSGKNCFSDVHQEWFAPFVCQAKSMGVIEGYSDNSFKPDQEINFSEAAKIIANTFDLNQSQKDPAVWFKSYIEALQQAKAIPLSVEYFDEKITRDEMAEIIWRIKADIKDKSSRTYQELSGDGLVQPSSCADLNERFLNSQPVYRGPILYKAMPMTEAVPGSVGEPAPATTAAPAPSDSSAGMSGASDSYSTTNVQEAGVDEADVIKNDGKYIYLIKNNTIRIVQAYPSSSLKELISFELGPKDEYFYPTEMYVDGDQLTVIGNSSGNYAVPMESGAKSIMPIRYSSSRTKVYIVDIKDRTSPKVQRTVDFDASYNTSRKVGSNLYLVMNHYPYYPMPYYDDYGVTSSSSSSTTSSNNYSDYLPRMNDSKDHQDVLIAPCTDIHIMPKPRHFNFLITAAIPLNDLSKSVSRNVLVGSSDNVYASTNNLYIADTDWAGPYYYSSGVNTRLYRFALSNGKISFEAQGIVPGTVLNQFSMDERFDQFRIATSDDSHSEDGKTSNNLYVLDSGLKTIGKLTGLALGEKLYSARFMGTRAYLVTFKSVDPLFVIDLADGKNPKLLGQLKIPGYSDYLHPYDATHIIGFGKDVDPAEAEKDQSYVYYTAVKGFKMALFDVADPANPKEMFKEIIGDRGTYSDLLNNHKALLFDREKNLLAFPISVANMPKQETVCENYNYSNCPSSCTQVCQQTCKYENGITVCDADCNGPHSCQDNPYVYPKTVFVGAYVYGLDLTNGFKLKAQITHLTQKGIEDLLTNGYAEYEKTIQRILYIGDSLYTVSPNSIKANSLSNPSSELNFIDLAGSLYNLTYGQSVTPSTP